MITTTTDIMTLGRIVCDLNITHGAALSGIDMLRIKPAIRINGTPHYSVDDIDRLATHLKAERLTNSENRYGFDSNSKQATASNL
ncbi:MAG: hypothetical protein AAGH92_07345 [Planctomycetota bacterium]